MIETRVDAPDHSEHENTGRDHERGRQEVDPIDVACRSGSSAHAMRPDRFSVSDRTPRFPHHTDGIQSQRATQSLASAVPGLLRRLERRHDMIRPEQVGESE